MMNLILKLEQNRALTLKVVHCNLLEVFFIMKPAVKEFQDDVELKKEFIKLKEQGVSKENLYVMSHDDDRTDRVADNISAGKLGEGLETAEGRVFTKKGDELRAQFKELGFSRDEANEFEKKLDHGTILLINTAS
jgi:hypothetical protein